MSKSFNRLTSLESLVSARNARRRAYQRAALAELDAKVGAELAECALSLGLAEIWQDHADATYVPTTAEEDSSES